MYQNIKINSIVTLRGLTSAGYEVFEFRYGKKYEISKILIYDKEPYIFLEDNIHPYPLKSFLTAFELKKRNFIRRLKGFPPRTYIGSSWRSNKDKTPPVRYATSSVSSSSNNSNSNIRIKQRSNK